jgi:hypothetical protein
LLIAAAVVAMAAIAAVTGAAAYAQPPAPPPPPPGVDTPSAVAPGVAVPAQPPPADASDEGFIEFLGSDDVGDTAWWEFLKRAPPRGSNPPAAPPQDASK